MKSSPAQKQRIRHRRIAFTVPFFIVSSLVVFATSNVMSSQLTKSLSQFATELYSNVVAEANPTDNVIISPLSVQTVLAMAYTGATGKTANEMANALKLQGDKSAVVDAFQSALSPYTSGGLVKMASKVYVKNGYALKPEFNTMARKGFQSVAENIDFDDKAAAVKDINQWVEESTNGKVKELMAEDMIDDETRLVLLNAIHFKGTWAIKFPVLDTRKEDFFVDETKSVEVDMMNVKGKFKFTNLYELNAKAVMLPYANSSIYMVIILPNERTGLDKLETNLKSLEVTNWSEQMFEETVVVKLPKFKIEHTVDLKTPLSKMGMANMFGSDATFDDMLDSVEPLQVSKIVHKAIIEVNEEGTEAAAATGMVMMMRCALPMDDLEFFADRPFEYRIYDKEILLFKGRLVKFD